MVDTSYSTHVLLRLFSKYGMFKFWREIFFSDFRMKNRVGVHSRGHNVPVQVHKYCITSCLLLRQIGGKKII